MSILSRGFLSSAMSRKKALLGPSLCGKVARFYSKAPVIGIDLGTTNSCVAIMRDSRPHIIENQEGKRTTPSVVAFTKDGGMLVGEAARRQMLLNGENTITSAKRLIGKKITDEDVAGDAKNLPYKVVPHGNGDAWVEAGGKKYSPAQIGAYVLRKLKEAAESHVGRVVSKAVITVPAYFTDTQRKATKDAGEIAGLKVLRVVNEPTAAALSYGIDTSTNGVVAVYDLGGGTFDVSILEIKDGVFEVKATNGNAHLGGDDFDAEITEHLRAELKRKTGIDAAADRVAMQRIREAAEKAKCELSSAAETEINVPYIAHVQSGPVHLEAKLSRSQLEEIISPFIEKTVGPCKAAMRDAGVTKAEINHVVMVGGMSRVPKIREVVKDVFGVHPIFGVNPDEAVAAGAAIQGGIISGELSDVLLIDVAPLSLGIETLGGVFSKIVEKNTSIPVKKSQVFTTAEDGQSSVNIKIYEGERPLVSHNKLLGEVILSGIPPAPKGVPKIEVTFEADANGIYTVTARDQGSSTERELRVEPSGGLTKEEIERMVEEAEANKEADERLKAFIEEKHKAQAYLEENKRLRERIRDRVGPETSGDLQRMAAEIEAIVQQEAGDADLLRGAVSALRRKCGEIYTKL